MYYQRNYSLKKFLKFSQSDEFLQMLVALFTRWYVPMLGLLFNVYLQLLPSSKLLGGR